MKRKKQCYFRFSCRLFRPAPQWVRATEDMAGKLDPAEVRKPTHEEIADYAIGLARDDPRLGGVASRIEEVFRWPSSAEPCRDERRVVLPVVEKYKKQAEVALRRHYAHHHVLALRRRRWLRAHPPPQSRGWTGKPLRNAEPVPRKRIFRPPDREGFPDAVSPPPPSPPAIPLNRPGSREKEILLCYDLLFGNRIAVRPYVDGLAKFFSSLESPFRRRRDSKPIGEDVAA